MRRWRWPRSRLRRGAGAGISGDAITEILEEFDRLGGRAQGSPRRKWRWRWGWGLFGGALGLVTMKHVGLDVAADVLFTATYTGVSGGLVIVSADDPGMASSQNEQEQPAICGGGRGADAGAGGFAGGASICCRAFISRKVEDTGDLRITTRVCQFEDGGGGEDWDCESRNLRFQI